MAGATSVGYVTAAARRDEGPILEYSMAQPPNELIDRATVAGETHGKSSTETPLYHGGVKYGLLFEDDTAMNLRNGRVEQMGDGMSSSLATEAESATRQWGTIKNTSQTSVDGVVAATGPAGNEEPAPITTQSQTADHIGGVPAWTEHDAGHARGNDNVFGPGADPWDDWDGCVPIAASMVIAYHEGISQTNDYAREAIIDWLHIKMDTYNGNTVWVKIDGGFDSYDRGSHSYNGKNHYNWGDGFVRNEVGAERPFLLNMMSADSANDGTGPYGDHAVTVVGYCCNTASLRIYDTWNSEDHYLNRGSWWQSMCTAVYPG
jgi:hypothetical protein